MSAVDTAAPPPPVSEPAPTMSTPAGDFDRRFASGIAWTGAAKWGTQLVTWATTIFVARLLTPSDYGLVGMAGLFLGVTALAAEFGVGAAVVRMRDLGRSELAQLNSVSLLLGVAAFALCALAAPLLGRFFEAAALPAVVIVLSIAFIVDALRVVPSAILQRDLQFQELAVLESGRAIVGAMVTLVLAWYGLGYWALVGGSLAASAAGTISIVGRHPHAFASPRMGAIQAALTYSRRVFTGRIAWYSYSNADFLVAGKLFGQAGLGAYTIAWNLASLPVEKITSLVTQVTPAFLSAVQHDRAALRRYFLAISEGLAFLTLPATLGLAAVAEDFVLVVLGEEWRAAIVPLMLLAWYASLRSLVTILPQVLNVADEARFAMRVTLATAIVLPPAFVLAGIEWGTIGIAATWLVVYPLCTIPLYRRTFARVGITAMDYLRQLRPAIGASLAMYASVRLVRHFLLPMVPPYALLGAEIAVGALVYCFIVLRWHRDRLVAFRAAVGRRA